MRRNVVIKFKGARQRIDERYAYRLAHAAGQDAGNRSMRKGKRRAWNETDYRQAARTFADVYNRAMNLIAKIRRNPYRVSAAVGRSAINAITPPVY